MGKVTNYLSKFSRHLVPGALGTFMICSAASLFLPAASGGVEPTGETSDYSTFLGPAARGPYSPELKDIFFDMNSYVIREDAKPVLDENADVLKNEPDTYVVIESYCDSREESSSTLGARRADSVKEYIISQGVSAGRVLTANKCNIYDMQLVSSKDTVRLDSRVHFTALDTIAERDKLASVR